MGLEKQASRWNTCLKWRIVHASSMRHLIAAGLSPLAPERELLAASRLFLKEIEGSIQMREDFAFETTLAGRSYLKLIHRLKADGWRVELIYLALPSMEMSKWRVAERVAHGGHNIPSEDIERRFARSLANLLDLFSTQTDTCRCYLNEGQCPNLFLTKKVNCVTSFIPNITKHSCRKPVHDHHIHHAQPTSTDNAQSTARCCFQKSGKKTKTRTVRGDLGKWASGHQRCGCTPKAKLSPFP